MPLLFFPILNLIKVSFGLIAAGRAGVQIQIRSLL
jgi:hypothetical protein